MSVDQYLIADSRAHIAALRRATDDETRDRILKAIRLNSRDIKTKEGAAGNGKKL